MLNNKYSRLRPHSGFTLIEILIAISIFSTLSMAAYQILQGVMRSDEISRLHNERLIELQRGMLLIERDFVQMVARRSRQAGVPDKKIQALYAGKKVLESDDEGIEFNRLGWTNPLNMLPRSNILRVGYRVKDEQLQRLYYLYPDTVKRQEPIEQVIFNDIEGLSFRYWGASWVDKWDDAKEIPKGIEVTIVSKHYGELTRIFMLPNSQVVD